MKPITFEWVEKAENDFNTMQREWRVSVNPNYDAVCFHAQQCAEKYLKARLQEENIPFRKTHDLGLLLDQILPSEPMWAAFRQSLEQLTAFAVEYRYPGESADKDDAQIAVKACHSVREVVRGSLGLNL